MDSVHKFLQRFHLSKDIDTIFTQGACYWFAHMLCLRFERENATLMYAPKDNHFGTMIYGRVYDVTGDVTEQYEWICWGEFDDEAERERIVRDCIMF